MTLTVRIPDDVAQRLRERASREGKGVEEYVLSLIERDALDTALASIPSAGQGLGPSDTACWSGLKKGAPPTDDEFERLLDELASGPSLPHLPADFSRADIYTDHD